MNQAEIVSEYFFPSHPHSSETVKIKIWTPTIKVLHICFNWLPARAAFLFLKLQETSFKIRLFWASLFSKTAMSVSQNAWNLVSSQTFAHGSWLTSHRKSFLCWIHNIFSTRSHLHCAALTSTSYVYVSESLKWIAGDFLSQSTNVFAQRLHVVSCRRQNNLQQLCKNTSIR